MKKLIFLLLIGIGVHSFAQQTKTEKSFLSHWMACGAGNFAEPTLRHAPAEILKGCKT